MNAEPTNAKAVPEAHVAPPAAGAKPPVSTETNLPPERSDGAPRGRLAGIYVRFGLGFSSFHDTMITDRRIDDRAVDESFVGGFSTVTELAVGGSVSRRFVLGAGFYGASIADPSFTYVRGREPPEGLKRPQDFAVFGLMGDFYFHPPRGLHIQAALGMATLSGFDADNQLFRPRDLALGGGAMLGVGYEWPAGDRWGIGILGRAVGGVTTETLEGQRWYHVIGVSPALLLSITYH